MGNLASAARSSSLSPQEYRIVSALTTYRVASAKQLQSVTDVLDVIPCLESLLTQNVISKVERHGVECYTLVPGALDFSLPDPVVPRVLRVASLMVAGSQVLTIKPQPNDVPKQITVCIDQAKAEAKNKPELWSEAALLGLFYVQYHAWAKQDSKVFYRRLATTHQNSVDRVRHLVRNFGAAGTHAVILECFDGSLSWLSKDTALRALCRENFALKVATVVREIAERPRLRGEDQSSWKGDVAQKPLVTNYSIKK